VAGSIRWYRSQRRVKSRLAETNSLMKMYILNPFSTIGGRSFLPANQLFPYTPKQQMEFQDVLRSERVRGSLSEVIHGGEKDNIEYQVFRRQV
jgi:hypothetical protein